ncbi:MAG: pilus assembly protein PilM [Deltaproteobacteria bacterium HGW-Deltaproteobacteria-10]|nr:MAG: pilus assembly protein PilM [Deltaproteobacteria bacterium HGW-Deltaproteobacteria-10]
MLNFDLFAGSKKIVGLDIGSSSLKLAEVISSSKGHILNQFLQIPLPKGIIIEGVLVDARELSLKVKELFKQAGLQRRGIATSLSGNSVIVKKVTFAQMQETELRELIRDEGGKYLPFDNMDDVNYDFQILGDNEFNPNQMDVIIVAAKKDIVNSYLDALVGAGLNVVIMDVDSFALETMYEANYEYENNEIVVMVNIGASITNINILKSGMSIFTRDFTLGGNSITEALQGKYQISFEEAEKNKIECSPDNNQDNIELQNSILDFAEPICSEIERSIDYFRSTFGGENIKHVFLSGGSARISGLAATLSQRLNIETEIVNPFLKIGYNKKNIDTKTLESIGPIAAVAIGLGLRKMDDK